MTATNHAITGAVIALIIGEPLIALPAALLSHFICDALPHFGSSRSDKVWLKTKLFRNMLIIDASVCVALVIILAVSRPEHWLLAAVCAFLATSPDLVWINHFRLLRTNKPWHPNLFSRFAASIQWFQRPIGAVVEAAWLSAGVLILATLIHA